MKEHIEVEYQQGLVQANLLIQVERRLVRETKLGSLLIQIFLQLRSQNCFKAALLDWVHQGKAGRVHQGEGCIRVHQGEGCIRVKGASGCGRVHQSKL